MSIRFKCAECGSSMKIKDELAGTTGKCPKCKTEFVVPAADEKEPVEVSASAATEEKSGIEDPEDEFQRILMGDSPRETNPRRRAVDSDAFLTSDSADDHSQADPPSTESESAPVAEGTGGKPKGRSTAEISAMLMKNTAEPTMKKTGRAFGEASNDKEAGRAKINAETRAYYVKMIGLGAVGVVVLAGGLYWLSSNMMGGVKYPPLARVSGTVTLDGKPIVGGQVSFLPMQEGLNAPSKGGGSAARTDQKGHYVLYYVQDVPGAVIGKHFVQVSAQSEIGLEMVPPKYNTSSELVLEVKPGSNPLDIKLTTN
jgi:hypothetical protein